MVDALSIRDLNVAQYDKILNGACFGAHTATRIKTYVKNGKAMKAGENMARRINRRKVLGVGLAGAINGLAARTVWPFGSHAPVPDPPPTLPGGLGLVFHSPKMTPYVNSLAIPPRRHLGGVIAMSEGLHEFHRDLPPAPGWGYDGQSYLGPTIEVERGERAEIVFANRLGPHILAADIDPTLPGVEPTDATQPRVSVHLHGAPNEPGSDGNPLATFVPGGARGYRFNNDLAATSLWYHDHAMGITRLNLYAGLAGMYWVRDEWDTGRASNSLCLPSDDFELPLIIQDRLFYRDGTLRYWSTPTVRQDQWQGGFLGDVMCVNGVVWPNLDVARGLYRLRVLNASSLACYRLHFSNAMTFWVIGSDGGLLDTPAPTASLLIDSGERYDILVDFSLLSSGDKVQLLNDQQIAVAGQLLGSKMIPNIMQFTARRARGFLGGVPQTLRGAYRQPPKLPSPPRTETVRTASLLELPMPETPFLKFSINNLTYSDNEIEMAVQGAVEYWDFVNTTTLPHAMHLHLVQFRVLGRQSFNYLLYRLLNQTPKPPEGTRWAPPVDPLYLIGEDLTPPESWEMGWKDTVRCPPATITRIAVRFPTAAELGFDPDAIFGTSPQGAPLQGYVWHCHLLDHEDHDMMLRYRLVAPGTSADIATHYPRLPICRASRRSAS